MELAKGVHHFQTGPFNWYLIEEAGQFTLVDAGFPGHYAVMEEGLRSIGCDKDAIAAIILTHAHADHTGFAERLRKERNIPVFVHKADAPMAARSLQLPWAGLLTNAWRPYTGKMLGRAIWNGVFTCPAITKCHHFQDAQILPVPGKPHVLHLPGHTPGESAFFLPERKLLFSGDTLVTVDLFSGQAGWPQLPNPLLNDDHSLANRSLDRLAELGEVLLLPGHGRPWAGNMKEAVRLARQP